MVNTAQCTADVLQNCAPEACMIVLARVTLINSIKKGEEGLARPQLATLPDNPVWAAGPLRSENRGDSCGAVARRLECRPGARVSHVTGTHRKMPLCLPERAGS